MTNLYLDSPRKKKIHALNKVRNERRDITTDTTQIQSIIGDYNEQLYSMEWIT